MLGKRVVYSTLKDAVTILNTVSTISLAVVLGEEVEDVPFYFQGG